MTKIKKTTVKGYTLTKELAAPNELERWYVSKVIKANDLLGENEEVRNYGFIRKVAYKNTYITRDYTVFWISTFLFKIGRKYFTWRKVANTRTEAVLILAKEYERRNK